MAKKLIKNYSFTAGVGLDENLVPNAYSLILQNRTFIIKEIVAFIQNQIDAGDPDYVGYTYSVAKCERDSGYVIDALLHDLRYGGNEEIYRVASTYWVENVAQIDGNRIPEFEAYGFAITLINTYILTNTEDLSPEQGIETQVIDETKTAEAGSTTTVNTLLSVIVDVITNGLGDLPVLNIQLGRVEVLGKIELEDLLLISNVTSNAIIYNFSDPTKGGTVEFIEDNTPNYPQATTVNNGVTVIRFKSDTSSMSDSDSLQIFLENTELKVRPYDFGTDAIERMRVGLPQAMIDADFEYGLQPTKWQAIGMQRGYPATYEISATDTPVSSVTTDASTGTSGVGGSLITVTTQGPHGFSSGTPITIRALASSITGFNRAEGTFIIFDVPSVTTFRYYAKAKVGTASGQVLATSTTQLREAGFYTGADVGVPEFSVHSQGASGTFDTALESISGTNILTFIGNAPITGVPLSGTGISAGTQVTGVFGPSNSDGVVDYKYVKTTYGTGTSAIELLDVINLQANMAVGNEASPNLLRQITSIVGTTINLNGTVTVGKTGDENTYNGSAVGVAGTGAGLELNLTTDGATIVIDSVAVQGSGYKAGDTILVAGTAYGESSPIGDSYWNVDEVDSLGDVVLTLINSPSISGASSYTNVATSTVAPLGSGATFNITRSAGVYTVNSISGGSGYREGHQYSIPGTSFEGASPANDVVITVTYALAGFIQSYTVSGTAARGDQIPVYATVTTSESLTTNVPAAETISYSAIATMQVDFATPHGFTPGMGINVGIESDDGANNHELAGGPFAVEQVISDTTIRYVVRAPGTVDDTDGILGTVYARPDAFFSHRPFDGGVQLGTGGPQHGAQAIRQSKKYIRYQSGKGAMYNTGALFAPSFDLRSVTAASTASGSLITIVTDDVDHGLQAGAVIKLSGIETTGYNGTYTVTEIVDERTFKVTAQTALGSTTGAIASQAQMALYQWHGATIRSGPYDDQNGIFFQYDGNQLAVVRRSATFQLAGTIAIDRDANSVTGTNTRFIDQLKAGDRVVIRGMTHVVSAISSNTAMTVTPDFRGVNNVTGVKICKVEDLVIPQSEWNLDRCDGTGPSGYNVDITKMQMIGIQFSWYGAGFIDWMFRGPNGDYVFCHRLKGNNLNTEAYMRTGNLPVRYEVLNEGVPGRLNGAMNDSQNTVVLDDTSLFPTSGTLYIDNEIISYSGKNDATNTLTGCTRETSLTNFSAGSTRTFTAGAAAAHDDNTGVILLSNTTSPIISHWGSAYMIDGLFDDDRGYIFSYTSTGVPIGSTKNTTFLIRLAPSVSNAVVGDLGERELLNRAQLLLKAVSISTNDQNVADQGSIVIEGVINPQNYPTDPGDIAWGGLSGLSAGGQPSFAQIAPGGSVDWGSITTTETATTQTFPTGSITARNVFGNTIRTNVNWFYITQADYNTYANQGFTTGLGLSGSGIAANTTITGIIFYGNVGGTNYYRIVMSNNGTSNVGGNVTITVTLSYPVAGTSRLFFQEASWNSTGVVTGDVVDDALFPTNTTVSSAALESFFGTDFYRVNFSQTSLSTVTPGSTTVDFTVGAPAYALPGETVFSFVAAPGETSTLDLSELKELTNTTIGGRGTFPNGPDVLAINVFKVTGADVNASIILRWGEAQA